MSAIRAKRAGAGWGRVRVAWWVCVVGVRGLVRKGRVW